MQITTDDVFTEPVLVQAGKTFDVSISGSFAATVVVQRSKDLTVWRDVESFTAPIEKVGLSGSTWYFRAGVASGGYFSGTVEVEVFE